VPRHGAAGLARALRRVPAGTPRRDGGSVTVEAAVALASLMAVLMLCLAGIACLIAAVRVTDAAGEAARLAARGDDEAARAAVSQLAPAGSVLSLSGGDFVTAQVAAPPLGHLLPGIHVEATAVAAREPESAGP
jgi:hypothetical protein